MRRTTSPQSRKKRRVKRTGKLPVECPYCGPGNCLLAPRTGDLVDVKRFQHIHTTLRMKREGTWGKEGIHASI